MWDTTPASQYIYPQCTAARIGNMHWMGGIQPCLFSIMGQYNYHTQQPRDPRQYQAPNAGKHKWLTNDLWCSQGSEECMKNLTPISWLWWWTPFACMRTPKWFVCCEWESWVCRLGRVLWSLHCNYVDGKLPKWSLAVRWTIWHLAVLGCITWLLDRYLQMYSGKEDVTGQQGVKSSTRW